MRIFVTGASGWIGSAVVPQLIGAGHQVVGLARSDASAAALTAAGAEARPGTLDDLDILRRPPPTRMASSIWPSNTSRPSPGTSRRPPMPTGAPSRSSVRSWPAPIARWSSLREPSGSHRAGWPPRRTATERTRTRPARRSERPAGHGRVGAVLRLRRRAIVGDAAASTNHGDGDNGFVANLVAIARDKGVSGYIGDGANRWPAVHRLDSAHLFRLALEAPAGSTLHAVADEGVPIRDIAEVIGRHLEIPVVSIAPEDAPGHFTWMADFLSYDAPASSAFTRKLLGWEPTEVGLLEDLDQGHYYQPAAP